ncbi:MAG: hypothetical protein H6656_06460 [Ardenticatenaceae bacterium]|nr:hypothetical protein [Ardenticatenaceae bacterium]
MPETDNHPLTSLKQIHQQILQHFNEEELRTLCFQVGVEYDDLGGRGKAANARELVQWAQRNNRLSDLMALIKGSPPPCARHCGPAAAAPHSLPPQWAVYRPRRMAA